MNAPLPDEVLVARGLSKRFRRAPWGAQEEVVALKEVDLVVRSGERVALMGQSGAGKTTLVRLLLGLDEPSEGDLWVLGRRWRELDRAALVHTRRRVQYVPQDAAGSLDPQQTVVSHLEETLRVIGKVEPNQARVEARRWLVQLGLDHRATALPRQLSGGEQRRLTLARVFALRPEVVVADEPTSGLDPARRREVLDQLMGGVGERSATVVVTHDPEVALGWCTRALVLLEGQVVEELSMKPPVEPRHAYVRQLFDPWGER